MQQSPFLLPLNSTITHSLHTTQPYSPTVEQYNYTHTPYSTAPLCCLAAVQKHVCCEAKYVSLNP
jgi:hypothetical protein